MQLLSILATVAFAALARAQVGPGVVTGNTAVHDPSMCKDAAGKYFVFCQWFIHLEWLCADNSGPQRLLLGLKSERLRTELLGR